WACCLCFAGKSHHRALSHAREEGSDSRRLNTRLSLDVCPSELHSRDGEERSGIVYAPQIQTNPQTKPFVKKCEENEKRSVLLLGGHHLLHLD
ncbi:Uncharacterized protein DAT39_009644, partial [Clarias magur]